MPTGAMALQQCAVRANKRRATTATANFGTRWFQVGVLIERATIRTRNRGENRREKATSLFRIPGITTAVPLRKPRYPACATRSALIMAQAGIRKNGWQFLHHYDSPTQQVAYPPKARCRNAAICPRVTSPSGQNRSFVGGLQPLVTPAVPRRSMSASNTEPSSSMNKSPAPLSV